jgi:hypothetical protein
MSDLIRIPLLDMSQSGMPTTCRATAEDIRLLIDSESSILLAVTTVQVGHACILLRCCGRRFVRYALYHACRFFEIHLNLSFFFLNSVWVF